MKEWVEDRSRSVLMGARKCFPVQMRRGDPELPSGIKAETWVGREKLYLCPSPSGQSP